MTASTVETAGEGGGDADGLRRLPMNAPTQGVLGGIMAWQRPDTPSAEQEECSLISRSEIAESERPPAAVGRRPSGTPKAPRSEIPDNALLAPGQGHPP